MVRGRAATTTLRKLEVVHTDGPISLSRDAAAADSDASARRGSGGAGGSFERDALCVDSMARYLGSNVFVRSSSSFRQRGGYLQHLFWYNSVVLAVTLLLSCVTFATMTKPSLVFAALYWVRVWHGLMSLPFVVFKLPLANRLLVGAVPTGYDRYGNTVVLRTAPVYEPPVA